MIGDDPDYFRALNAFHHAVHAAYQAWEDTRDEPWPGWDNMSPRQRAELGIPEPPPPPEPRPLPPHLDPAGPDFQVPRYLHPSQYSPEVRAAVDAQNAAIAEAEAAVTTRLDAHFAAWNREAEP
jgi:hypothetical protein